MRQTGSGGGGMRGPPGEELEAWVGEELQAVMEVSVLESRVSPKDPLKSLVPCSFDSRPLVCHELCRVPRSHSEALEATPSLGAPFFAKLCIVLFLFLLLRWRMLSCWSLT